MEQNVLKTALNESIQIMRHDLNGKEGVFFL